MCYNYDWICVLGNNIVDLLIIFLIIRINNCNLWLNLLFFFKYEINEYVCILNYNKLYIIYYFSYVIFLFIIKKIKKEKCIFLKY